MDGHAAVQSQLFDGDFLNAQILADNMPGAFLVYKATEDEDILFASEGVARIFECDSVEEFMKFTGGSFITLVYPEDIEKINRTIWDQLSVSGGFDNIKYRVITKNGHIKDIEDWGHLVHSKELDEDIFYVFLWDTEAREKLTSLFAGQEARWGGGDREEGTDNLTGLLNMHGFRIKAPDAVRRFMGEGKDVHCIYLNIRNFHTYNETYGFAGGDRVLKSVARILQDTFPGDVISRLSDDHFTVITAREGLKEKIGRMSVRVSNIRRGVIVEVKAGVYHVTDPKMDVSLICDCARLACDSIKRVYGTTVQFYDGKLGEKLRLREYILESFPSALEKGWFKVFYQPIVDVSTKQVLSLEALTRWEDPRYGLLPPGQFIDVLEEEHQIHKMDTFVIQEVCREVRRRAENGLPEVPVSLNLSRLDFELTDIIRVIEEAVTRYDVKRDLLRFEITESLIAADANALRQETDQLRQHGFKVWMDAFGSGYSSLKMLKDFSLDGLKIDMDMIHSYDNERSNAIIATIISLAKRLGIPALSKGVETPEQLAFLKEAGCDLAQGYLFAKPEPSDTEKK
ncbi:MAG: GGDEF and EAL domain-containing protein [Fretibacterium sp.]|nr:GGDEF and EAL domain-containing protein [Fretibacterium sp.]